MSFASWQEFFAMGGYALYVWSSYGLTLFVLTAVATAPWLRHRRLLRELARRERLEQREQRKPESS